MASSILDLIVFHCNDSASWAKYFKHALSGEKQFTIRLSSLVAHEQIVCPRSTGYMLIISPDFLMIQHRVVPRLKVTMGHCSLGVIGYCGVDPDTESSLVKEFPKFDQYIQFRITEDRVAVSANIREVQRKMSEYKFSREQPESKVEMKRRPPPPPPSEGDFIDEPPTESPPPPPVEEEEEKPPPLAPKKHSLTQSGPARVSIFPTEVRNDGELLVLVTDDVGAQELTVEMENRATRDRQKFTARQRQKQVYQLHFTGTSLSPGLIHAEVYNGQNLISITTFTYQSSTVVLNQLLNDVVNPIQLMSDCLGLDSSNPYNVDRYLSERLRARAPCKLSTVFKVRKQNSVDRRLPSSELPTLLHFSAYYNLPEVTRVLLDLPGSDRALNVTNSAGQTPVNIAADAGHDDIVNIFTDHQEAQVAEIYLSLIGAGEGAENAENDESGDGDDAARYDHPPLQLYESMKAPDKQQLLGTMSESLYDTYSVSAASPAPRPWRATPIQRREPPAVPTSPASQEDDTSEVYMDMRSAPSRLRPPPPPPLGGDATGRSVDDVPPPPPPPASSHSERGYMKMDRGLSKPVKLPVKPPAALPASTGFLNELSLQLRKFRPDADDRDSTETLRPDSNYDVVDVINRRPDSSYDGVSGNKYDVVVDATSTRPDSNYDVVDVRPRRPLPRPPMADNDDSESTSENSSPRRSLEGVHRPSLDEILRAPIPAGKEKDPRILRQNPAMLELLELQEDYKDGKFNIEETTMRFQSWLKSHQQIQTATKQEKKGIARLLKSAFRSGKSRPMEIAPQAGPPPPQPASSRGLTALAQNTLNIVGSGYDNRDSTISNSSSTSGASSRSSGISIGLSGDDIQEEPPFHHRPLFRTDRKLPEP